jgi:hypothetical protein
VCVSAALLMSCYRVRIMPAEEQGSDKNTHPSIKHANPLPFVARSTVLCELCVDANVSCAVVDQDLQKGPLGTAEATGSDWYEWGGPCTHQSPPHVPQRIS